MLNFYTYFINTEGKETVVSRSTLKNNTEDINKILNTITKYILESFNSFSIYLNTLNSKEEQLEYILKSISNFRQQNNSIKYIAMCYAHTILVPSYVGVIKEMKLVLNDISVTYSFVNDCIIEPSSIDLIPVASSLYS